MTGQKDNMDNQLSLLSSKLLLKHRQVEVLLSRASLTWKEIGKSKKRLYSGFSETGESSKNFLFSFYLVKNHKLFFRLFLSAPQWPSVIVHIKRSHSALLLGVVQVIKEQLSGHVAAVVKGLFSVSSGSQVGFHSQVITVHWFLQAANMSACYSLNQHLTFVVLHIF